MRDLREFADLAVMRRHLASLQAELRTLNIEGHPRNTVMYAELVDCHAGVYIPREFCESIGDERCQDPEEEGYWDEADEVYNEYCEALGEINKDNFRDLGMTDARFFIGTLDFDGSLALFLYDPEFSDTDEDVW